MPKLVYDFTEGNKDLKDLLGGKSIDRCGRMNGHSACPERSFRQAAHIR